MSIEFEAEDDYLADFNQLTKETKEFFEEGLKKYLAKYPDVDTDHYFDYSGVNLYPVHWDSSSGECGWLNASELAPDYKTAQEAKSSDW